MKLRTVFSHRVRRVPVLLGAFTMLVSYAGFLAAAPPDLSEDNGIPRYLENEFAAIRQMLELNAQKLDELSAQLAEVETELKADIGSAKEEVKTDMAVLSGKVDDALAILNAPDKDIELTTEVCFDLGASWDFVYSAKLTAGLGWEGGVKLDGVAELSMPGGVIVPAPIPPMWTTALPIFPALSSSVGSTVCLTVPLYSVASNEHWITDFDTSDFDRVIAGVALPAQTILPGLAKAISDVMPDPTLVMDFLEDGLKMVVPPGATKGNKTYLLSEGQPLNQTILLSNGMRVTQAALDNASDSYSGMLLSSDLLQNIVGPGNIQSAMADPCGLPLGLGLAWDAALCRGVVDDILDIFDPACLLDPIFPHKPAALCLL